MIYRPILIKTFAKIPDTTNKEVSMVVDSITHINELSFRDAVKDMATKADIKDMATKADIKDMATKTDIAELKAEMYRVNNRTIMWIVGVGVAVAGIVIAVAG